ncbi:MAG: hypothetical protein BRC28_01560 [Nanohaloarchaea archaeon SW_4_43_9]|nr:MAG: hypothetical protein BRC28_01560 [Nanohaloarchaea archaeon SW_4_43_9]
MAVAGFNQLLETMARMDFFTGVLPFVLTYVVLYAALKKVPVISDQDDKNFPALVAIIGAFFVARFIVVNPLYQAFFVEYFGKLVIGLMGFVGLLILLAFTGYNLGEKGGLKSPMVVMLMVAVAGLAFATSGGLGFRLPTIQGLNLQAWLTWFFQSGAIWILVVLGSLWWVSGSDDGSDGSGPPGWMLPFTSNDWWKDAFDDDNGG